MQDRIDGKYVHKRDPRNVLLAYVRQPPGQPDRVESEMVHDIEHPFFFEHPLDHIPAMMLVEAGRQLGIAVSHLFLGVPLDRMFATRSFDIRFDDFAELHTPVLIVGALADRKYHRGELLHLRFDGVFSQGGREIGRMGGSWSMLDPAVWRRYRRREQARIGVVVG
jgi:hypothetical protein